MTTKHEFLEALQQRLSGLQDAERDRLMDYFEEMIDDRLEMGMDEASAVSALGSIDDLIRDAAPSAMAPLVPAGSGRFDGEITEIHLHLKNADGAVCLGRLPDAMSAQLNASAENVFTWSLEGGVLTVREVGEVRRGLFRQSQRISVTLGNARVGRLIADSYGGDIHLDGLEIAEMAVLSSSSGDIEVKHVTCVGRTEITVRSGDIKLSDARCQGDLKLESVSGDVTLKHASAGSLRLRTTSGDIEIETLSAQTVALGAASGDVDASMIRAGTSFTCETTSGDVDVDGIAAPDVRISAASGDIDLKLPRGAWRIQAQSRSGEVQLPETVPAGEVIGTVQLNTSSGDILVRTKDRY